MGLVRGAVVRLAARVGAQPALAATLALGIVVAFGFAFLFARVYDAVTESDGVAALDPVILQAAITLRSPVVDTVTATVAVVFGAVCMPIIAALAAAAFGISRRSWTPVVLVVATGLGSLAMTVAGKDIIGRHRPPRSLAIPPFETSPSFPSGHTLNAVAIVGIVAYLLVVAQRAAAARAAAVVAAVFVPVLVGATRVVSGAHWFTDVLSAWLLGGAWLALVITVHQVFRRRRRPVDAAAAF